MGVVRERALNMNGRKQLRILLVLGLLAGTAGAHASQAVCINGNTAADELLPLDRVTVAGAVERPIRIGRGSLEGGVRVNDAIEQAGGLTRDAYAIGAFLFRRIPSLATAPRGSSAYADLSAGALEALQIAMAGPYADEVRDALIDVLRRDRGFVRMPVAADAAMQRRFPERNPILKHGDVLYIPQRTGNIAVLGAVSAPGYTTFETGSLVEDYIEGAGGLLGGARLAVAGVYLPSGELRPLDQSPWKYQPQNVPPGSIVVVPYRNESLQRYARDARAARTLPRVTATADGGGGEDGQVASLLPPLAEATTQCPAP